MSGLVAMGTSERINLTTDGLRMDSPAPGASPLTVPLTTEERQALKHLVSREQRRRYYRYKRLTQSTGYL